MKILEVAILSFIGAIFGDIIRSLYFPESYANQSISVVFVCIITIAIIVMLILPTVISLRTKELLNRKTIICLSLMLPIFGGFFSYFLLRNHYKYMDNNE